MQTLRARVSSSGERLIPAAMRRQEYDRLRELLRTYQPRRTLEIGMANGGSSVVICEELRRTGNGNHTAIDPFQSASNGWNGQGIATVKAAGLSDLLEVIEDFDYSAMPRLVTDGRLFDFILIDGWHSFDYTLVDMFFADLLLQDGGILAIHDTGWPAVHKACRFVETHKPYRRLSPPVSIELKNLPAKLLRRAIQLLRGPGYYRAMKSRRTEWFSLAAYQKTESRVIPDDYYSDF